MGWSSMMMMWWSYIFYGDDNAAAEMVLLICFLHFWTKCRHVTCTYLYAANEYIIMNENILDA